MNELFGHWLDRGPKSKPMPRTKRPLPGQRPLFDECTPELVIYGGEAMTQGVLFGPPESAGEPAAVQPMGARPTRSQGNEP
jgi:hypothetical protein